MHILRDIKTGERTIIRVCHQCDPDTYPKGKPILPNDMMAKKDEKGNWVCSECQTESLNRMFLRTLGPNHPKCQAFIKQEDNDCKRWNNYVKRVNENMRAGLKYKKNRYTGRIPF
jgi:hypothetical protein